MRSLIILSVLTGAIGAFLLKTVSNLSAPSFAQAVTGSSMIAWTVIICSMVSVAWMLIFALLVTLKGHLHRQK